MRRPVEVEPTPVRAAVTLGGVRVWRGDDWRRVLAAVDGRIGYGGLGR